MKTFFEIIVAVAVAGMVFLVVINNLENFRKAFLMFYQYCLNVFQSLLSVYMWSDFLNMILALLLIAGLIRGIWYMIRQMYFYKKFSQNVYLIGKKMVLAGCNVWVIDDDKKFAFTAGILNPQIYISSAIMSILSKKELESVVLHEKYHRDNFHPLVSLIYTFISRIMFFIPLFSYFVNFLSVKHEIDADRYTIDQIGRDSLSSSLLKILEVQDSVRYGFNIYSFSSILPRVEFILYNKRYVFKIPLKILVFSIVMIFFVLLNLTPLKAQETENYHKYFDNQQSACHYSYSDYFKSNFDHNYQNMTYLP